MISKELKTLYGWYIYSILYEIIIKDFFTKFVNKKIFFKYNIIIINSEIIKYIKLSKIPVLVTIQVSFDYNIIELMKNVRIHMHY